MRKQMEGDNRERRKMAQEARREGKSPSEIGATLGASKQRQRTGPEDTHQQRLDAKQEGKTQAPRRSEDAARPRSRDGDTMDTERPPRR